MRHSLTLLHFIIHRLAGVLCSDSESCCQSLDYDGSTDEITGKSNSGEMVKYSGEVQLFYPSITLKSSIKVLVHAKVLYLICGTGLVGSNCVWGKLNITAEFVTCESTSPHC